MNLRLCFAVMLACMAGPPLAAQPSPSGNGETTVFAGMMLDAGMSPLDAIRSATIVAADLLGVDDQLGEIAIGKAADLIAVDGDPLKDLRVLEAVDFVMKEGVVVTLDGQ